MTTAGRNIVLCLDGTNNRPRAGGNTNVLRTYDLLDHADADRQVAYYGPGVGTSSSPAAWSPPARLLSRYAGLAFGAGLRRDLADAYRFLVTAHRPGDRIFVFGFSRGAYTARALTGLLEVFGLLRPDAANLVPYAVGEYTRRRDRSAADWKILRDYARIFARRVDGRTDHAPVHFLGIWDSVKAAGTLRRELCWPYTRQLPHVAVVRHAVAIDERRRPYREYLLHRPDPRHAVPSAQDLLEVWFAGAHSDVGGVCGSASALSDITLKWMVEQATEAGLLVRPRALQAVRHAVSEQSALAASRPASRLWRFLGTRARAVPDGALVHASVERRAAADPAYRQRLPARHTVVDEGWAGPPPLTPAHRKAAPLEAMRP